MGATILDQEAWFFEFIEPIAIEDGRVLWRVRKCFRGVPTGYETDLASSPVWASLWPLGVTQYGLWTPASIVHDWEYETEMMRPEGYGEDSLLASQYSPLRAQADRNFYESMRADGVSRVRAWIMYRAVRVGGGVFWWRHTPERVLAVRKLLGCCGECGGLEDADKCS